MDSPSHKHTFTHKHTSAQAEATVGEAAVDVTVIARTVEKEDFYENGKHF